MASKTFQLTDELPVTVYKRKLSRSIRLSIAANGQIRVSIPTWVAFKAGHMYAKSKLDWISSQRQTPGLLTQGQSIGRSHQLQFRVSARLLKPSSRIKDGKVIITHPLTMPTSADSIQSIAAKASIRAMKQEASRTLPVRLRELSIMHGFTYREVTIKQLTSRWGSCDQNQKIALNLFLVQLPDNLIDYVLIHELVHTRYMDHGSDFWATFEAVLPGARKLRTEIRKHKPVVIPASTL